MTAAKQPSGLTHTAAKLEERSHKTTKYSISGAYWITSMNLPEVRSVLGSAHSEPLD